MIEQVADGTHRIDIRRIFDAPREKVFDAWTKPKVLMKWWGAGSNYSPTLAEIDLRVGGKYRLGMTPLNKPEVNHVSHGIYREINRPEKLVFTWNWEDHPMEQDTLVTIIFNEVEDGKTEVLFVHELFPDAEIAGKHTEGWTGVLENLEKQLAG